MRRRALWVLPLLLGASAARGQTVVELRGSTTEYRFVDLNHTFKKGVFLAAMEAGSRIVPVALRGTRTLLPKGGFSIVPGEVIVELLPPVPAGPDADREELMAEVRSRIAAALA